MTNIIKAMIMAASLLTAAVTPVLAWDGHHGGGGGWHGGGGGYHGGWHGGHGGAGNWVAPFVGGAIVGGALGGALAYPYTPYYSAPYTPYYAAPTPYYSPYYDWRCNSYGQCAWVLK